MSTKQLTETAVGTDPISSTRVSRRWRLTGWQAKQRRIAQRRLTRAVRENVLPEVQLLLKHGVDLKTFARQDPLGIAIACGLDSIVDVLVTAGVRSSQAMFVAAVMNKPVMLRRLLEAWDRPPLSMTLWWAARAGALEAAKFLLTSGAKDKGATTLVAVQRGHVEVVQLILAHGARPNGHMLRACAFGPDHKQGEACLRLLLASGIDADTALRRFPPKHITHTTLVNMGQELGLCALLARFATTDPNYAKAKVWIEDTSKLANTYEPARNWRNRSDARRFNEALALTHRELYRCAALFEVEHKPNAGITALML